MLQGLRSVGNRAPSPHRAPPDGRDRDCRKIADPPSHNPSQPGAACYLRTGGSAPAAGAITGGVAGRPGVAAAGAAPAGTAVNSTLTCGSALSSLCTAMGVTSMSTVERITEDLSNTMLAPRSVISPFRIGSREISTCRAALLKPAWISA